MAPPRSSRRCPPRGSSVRLGCDPRFPRAWLIRSSEGPTSVFWTQPEKLDESTCTKPFFWSPLAMSSSLLVSVATTLLSLDGPAYTFTLLMRAISTSPAFCGAPARVELPALTSPDSLCVLMSDGLSRIVRTMLFQLSSRLAAITLPSGVLV